MYPNFMIVVANCQESWLPWTRPPNFIIQRLFCQSEEPHMPDGIELAESSSRLEATYSEACAVCGSLMPLGLHSVSMLLMFQRAVSGRCQCRTETATCPGTHLIQRNSQTYALKHMVRVTVPVSGRWQADLAVLQRIHRLACLSRLRQC